MDVKDLSDKELEEYIQEVCGRTVPWVCEASATVELLRRYKNKKKECEELIAEKMQGDNYFRG